MYICDLAEWGVVIDDAKTTESIKAQYWDPMWKVSYTIDDCPVDEVMDGLKIDRTAPSKYEMTKMQLKEVKDRMRATQNVPTKSEYYPQKESSSVDDASDEVVSDGED